MASSSDRVEIDMTLRLQSGQIPMRPIVEALGVTPQHLHVAGEPMASEGRLAQRRASRHYASVLQRRVESDTAVVAAWCRLVIEKIEAQKSLANFLREGQISGTMWIAVFGPESSPVPAIPADIVDAAARLKLSVFLENYTDLSDGGIPKKLWLINQAENT
jgi:hypothetical protein